MCGATGIHTSMCPQAIKIVNYINYKTHFLKSSYPVLPYMPYLMRSAEQQSAPSVLATTNRWQMVTLHPVALGLTVMKREYPETFQSLCHI